MPDLLDDSITIETDLFEHRKVGPHFINPCCFGEDLAAWLKHELSTLVGVDFTLSDPIQEDYGWGFWANHGEDPFWIALSFVGEGPQETPGRCVVSVTYDGRTQSDQATVSSAGLSRLRAAARPGLAGHQIKQRHHGAGESGVTRLGASYQS